MRTYLSLKQENKIVSNYKNGLTIQLISKVLNINKNAIYSCLKRNSVIMRNRGYYRKYKMDEDFFINIDSEKKSYILGFVMADGYNNPTKQTLRIVLNYLDIDILQKIQRCLKTNSPIKHITQINTNLKKKHRCVLLSLYGKNFCKILSDKGCTNNKSFTLKFPSFNIVPKKFVRHFIRGYFDGDGGISLRKNGYSISICGNFHFCTELLKQISHHTNIQFHIYKHSTIYKLSLNRKRDNFLFLKWLYNNSNIYLNRKFNIYKKINKERLYL